MTTRTINLSKNPAVLLLLLLVSTTITMISAQRICNGLSSNCKMRANEITYPSSHNVMASIADGFYFPNNKKSLEEALEAGIRGLLLDSCDCNGVQFCHSECFLGTKDPTMTFVGIAEFLNENPNEILIIEIQVDDDTLLDLWEFTSEEFRSMVYTKDNDEDDSWPTLNAMIDANQRMIVFQHAGSNTPRSDCTNDGECPDGVYNFYDYGFQTPWDLNEDGLNNYETSCQFYVGQRSGDFIMNNHFAKDLLPDEAIARRINTVSKLQDRMKYCTDNVWEGKNTSLLVVDFWSVGDVVDAANEQNAALGGVDDSSSDDSVDIEIPMGCFSGNSMVVTKQQNGDVSSIPMKDLRLGGFVLVNSDDDNYHHYEKVYSFAHYHTTMETEYMQLLPSKLELTPQHLVYVQNYQEPIPASSVQVGDVLLQGMRSNTTRVTKIRIVKRQGMYAPLTPSGTIIVNGVKASNYIALQPTNSSYLLQMGSTVSISHHAVSHMFVTFYYRLYSLINTEEVYTRDGVAFYLDGPYQLFIWMLQEKHLSPSFIITTGILLLLVVAATLLVFTIMMIQRVVSMITPNHIIVGGQSPKISLGKE